MRTKTYAQEWIDSTNEPKQAEKTILLEAQHELGLTTRLYRACLQTFRDICRDDSQVTTASDRQSTHASGRRSRRLLSHSKNRETFECHCCVSSFITEQDLAAHVCTYESPKLMDHPRRRSQENSDPLSSKTTTTPASEYIALCIKPVADSQTSSDQGRTPFVLKDQLAKFFLWGDGFSDGRLDKALDQSDELRNTVLELLCDLGLEIQKSVLNLSIPFSPHG